MASITVNNNQPTTIDVNNLVNGGSNGKWKISGTNIVHDNKLGSYIDLPLNNLNVGSTYKLTYTVSSHTSCNITPYLGSTAGTTKNATGTYTDTLVLNGQKVLRFWSNGTLAVSNVKLEELVTTLDEVKIEPNNTQVVNKSFTLSYNPVLEQWISHHSYLPNNYLPHPTKFIAKRNNTQLMLSSSGQYGKYFDNDIKPFIIETIFNDNPLYTKVFDNITVNLISETTDKVSTNKFFDKVILNNEYQCSGEIVLNLNNLTKKERNWSINKFEDLTNSSSNSLFSKDWSDIKNQYPIDKVVNPDKIDNAKPWYQRARFRDKYLTVRFIENNLENNKIIVKFVSSIYRQSFR